MCSKHLTKYIKKVQLFSKHKVVCATQSSPWIPEILCRAALSDADFCVGNVWVTQSFFVVHAIFVRAPWISSQTGGGCGMLTEACQSDLLRRDKIMSKPNIYVHYFRTLILVHKCVFFLWWWMAAHLSTNIINYVLSFDMFCLYGISPMYSQSEIPIDLHFSLSVTIRDGAHHPLSVAALLDCVLLLLLPCEQTKYKNSLKRYTNNLSTTRTVLWKHLRIRGFNSAALALKNVHHTSMAWYFLLLTCSSLLLFLTCNTHITIKHIKGYMHIASRCTRAGF